MKTTFQRFIDENDFYQVKTMNSEPFYAYNVCIHEDNWVEAHRLNRQIASGEYEAPVYYIPPTGIEYVRKLSYTEKTSLICDYIEDQKLYRTIITGDDDI